MCAWGLICKNAGGNLPQALVGKTRDKVGEAIGMSGKTYEAGKKVFETGSDELIQAMDSKSASISTAADWHESFASSTVHADAWNLIRRHLNESQRGMVAAKIANMQIGDTSHNLKKGTDIPDSANLQSREEKISRAQAAELLNCKFAVA